MDVAKGDGVQLLLHIGSPKAGSTTLQAMLHANKAALAEQGVLAWEADVSKGASATVLSSRFLPRNRPLLPHERLHFSSRAEATAWSEANWSRMIATVRSDRPPLTVISSEGLFAATDVASVNSALGAVFDTVTILAYVRDPAAHYVSALDQQIRAGARLSDLPLPGRFHLPPFATVRNWRGLLGPERVILRNFSRENLVDGDLVTDFLSHLGQLAGRPVVAPVPTPRANESLCAAAALVLLACNETFERFSRRDDRAEVRHRMALIRRLRTAPELSGMAKLALDDPEIVAWARQAAAGAVAFYNTLLDEDARLVPAAPDSPPPPDDAAQRARLRAWVLAQVPAAARTP